MSVQFSGGARLFYDGQSDPVMVDGVLYGTSLREFGNTAPDGINGFCDGNPTYAGWGSSREIPDFLVRAIELPLGAFGHVGSLQAEILDSTSAVLATIQLSGIPAAGVIASFYGRDFYGTTRPVHITLSQPIAYSTIASVRLTTDTPPYLIITGYDEWGTPIIEPRPGGGYIGIMVNVPLTPVAIPNWGVAVPGPGLPEYHTIAGAIYARPHIWWQVI